MQHIGVGRCSTPSTQNGADLDDEALGQAGLGRESPRGRGRHQRVDDGGGIVRAAPRGAGAGAMR